jgi:hypothetical protein
MACLQPAAQRISLGYSVNEENDMSKLIHFKVIRNNRIRCSFLGYISPDKNHDFHSGRKDGNI